MENEKKNDQSTETQNIEEQDAQAEAENQAEETEEIGGIKLSAEEKAAAQEVLKKHDVSSNFRQLDGVMAKVIFVIAVAWSSFQLYTALFGVLPSTLQRAPSVGFALCLVFLLYPMRRKNVNKGIPWYDFILAGLGVGVAYYHIHFYAELLLRAGRNTQLDFIVSFIAVVLILEATRRIMGKPMLIVAGIVLIYATQVGAYFPGFLRHRGFSIERIVTFQWTGTEGILGTPIAVFATFIFLFLLFATFLKLSGVGDWLTGLAIGAVGDKVGGPAKVAVVASVLQGSVSGSSVANAVATGPITIPMMKSTGYSSHYAGGVEAASSVGGQMLPPIMGAAAFIMAEFTGVPFPLIALGALIPSLLYFTGIFSNVHFEAVKRDLKGVPKEELPNLKAHWKRGWYMISPMFVIIGMLLAGFTVMRAALFAIGACLLIWIIEDIRRPGGFRLIEFIKKLIKGLEQGARSALAVACACACAGIIVGIITLTGVGLRAANGIVQLAGGHLLVTLIFVAFTSIIIGLGVPTTAKYIIMATIAAPALMMLDVPPIAAHMFVFYYAVIADMTPPVALTSYATAGIAKADPMRTSVEGFKIGFSAYIIPFIFVYHPALLFVNADGWPTGLFAVTIAKGVIIAILSLVCMSTLYTGYFRTKCRLWERLALVVAAVLLIYPGVYLIPPNFFAGVGIIALVFVIQTLRMKKAKTMAME